MVNLTSAFSQSESGKYFEWIIMIINYINDDDGDDDDDSIGDTDADNTIILI